MTRRCTRWIATVCRVATAVLLLSVGACATARPMPEIDLASDGWKVWTGQALWQPPGDRPRVAGELMVARHSSGDVMVSFAKPPLPIFTAQTADRVWRLDVAGQKSYGGSGRPPRRFVWFSLPEILEGRPAPKKWTVERPYPDEVVLRKTGGGETIRVVLDP